MAALDASNAAQEFARGNLRIVMVEPIPTGDPIGGALVDCPLYYSVSEQSPLPGKQYDIAGKRLGGTAPAHRKDVARPHRGQHTASGHPQAQLTRRAEHVFRQVAFQCLVIFRHADAGSCRHDIFQMSVPWFQRPAPRRRLLVGPFPAGDQRALRRVVILHRRKRHSRKKVNRLLQSALRQLVGANGGGEAADPSVAGTGGAASGAGPARLRGEIKA
jgi:hypothetical protein